MKHRAAIAIVASLEAGAIVVAAHSRVQVSADKEPALYGEPSQDGPDR